MSRSLSAHDPRFDEEVCMLSPVHASHDGVNTALSAEEAGGFALSTPRQGQLAGLRDAVGNRVTLVGFCVSKYSHWITALLETGYICYAGVSQCTICTFSRVQNLLIFYINFFTAINFYWKIYKLQCQ
jgi:hypothetical protein